MLERLDDLLDELRGIVRGLDPERLRADDAMQLTEKFAEGERLMAAARTLTFGRVSATRGWRSTGASSAPAWMAAQAGVSIGDARRALETASKLRTLPEVRDAFVDGKLSAVQAAEIASASAVDPSAQTRLLAVAETGSVSTLREVCEDIRAAAVGDEDAAERIRRSRFLRFRGGADTAVAMDGRFAPADFAPLKAVVESRARKLFEEARATGNAEPFEAYMADALVSLADGAGAPKTVVNVHVSAEALERGHVQPGETCRIEGVGPVTVADVKRLALKGSVRVIETDGTDVRRVAHQGRTIPAKLRTALEVRDPHCVVPGCGRRHGLEIDHITPISEGGLTTLENLARLCAWHHAQKTYHGWRLEGSHRAWRWVQRPHAERAGRARAIAAWDAATRDAARDELTPDARRRDASAAKPVKPPDTS